MKDAANVELEVKLTLEPEALAGAAAVLAARSGAGPVSRVSLRNLYFDTPDFALHRQKVALRVRQQGSRFIQTLKTRGEFVDGGHRRMEWEWPLSGPELDLSLLADTPLADQADLRQLAPVFETNFERRVILINETDQGGHATVEAAMDQGRILSGDRVSPLCEVEFELKSGNPDVLRQLAVTLADSVPVFLNVISKAEQGYHLAGGDPASPEVPETADVYGFLRCLSQCWLHRAPFPLRPAQLSQVRQVARDAGVVAEYDGLVDQLLAGPPVNGLISNGRLGRVQLALAGAGSL